MSISVARLKRDYGADTSLPDLACRLSEDCTEPPAFLDAQCPVRFPGLVKPDWAAKSMREVPQGCPGENAGISIFPNPLKRMVGPTGFEPVTSAMSRQRSNQLSYGPRRSGFLDIQSRATQFGYIGIGGTRASLSTSAPDGGPYLARRGLHRRQTIAHHDQDMTGRKRFVRMGLFMLGLSFGYRENGC